MTKTKTTNRPTKTGGRSATQTAVVVDRRGHDRRQTTSSGQPPVGLPERRKVQRRRQIDPTTCERDYTNDEIEFMQAMDAYKRASGRMFPTCSEILEVIRGLGYVKITGREQCNSGTFEPSGERGDETTGRDAE